MKVYLLEPLHWTSISWKYKKAADAVNIKYAGNTNYFIVLKEWTLKHWLKPDDSNKVRMIICMLHILEILISQVCGLLHLL